jgi:hypothetical protein
MAFFDPVGGVPMAPICPLYSEGEPGSLPAGVGNPQVADVIGMNFADNLIGTAQPDLDQRHSPLARC